jgi:hypothetical protein
MSSTFEPPRALHSGVLRTPIRQRGAAAAGGLTVE